MCIRKQSATAGKSIDVWRMNSAPVPAEAIHPVPHVVDTKKQNVRPRRSAFSMSDERNQKGEVHGERKKAQLRHSFHFFFR